MKKRILTFILTIVSILMCIFGLSACKDDRASDDSSTIIGGDTNCEHIWSDWTEDQEATCKTTGLQSRICTLCEGKEEKIIEKTAHKYNWLNTCEYCGEERDNNSDLQIDENLIFELINEETEYQVSDYVGNASEIIIPSCYKGKPVTEIKADAKLCVSKVQIPKSITKIGDSAFTSGCIEIVNYLGTIDDWVQITFAGQYANPLLWSGKLYIDNKLVTEARLTNAKGINSYAFSYYRFLTKVTIPESVKYIGQRSFDFCTALTSINIPSSVTQIDCGAFGNCYNLVEVCNNSNVDIQKEYISEHIGLDYVKNVYSDNFGHSKLSYSGGAVIYNDGVENLVVGYDGTTTDIVIPYGVLEIKERAFNDYGELSSVSIPDSIIKIGSYAFNNCDLLASIKIPDSVTNIGGFAFWSTYSDTTSLIVYCEVIEKPSEWSSDWNKYRPTVWNCNNNEIADDGYIYITIEGLRYGIKDNIAIVAEQLDNITTADIKEHVEYKGNSYKVSHIGEYAFSDCQLLSGITIPDGIISIGYAAFNECYSLQKIEIPDSVVSIEGSAFAYCNNLIEITLGKGITEIDSNAFRYCVGLKNVYYTGTIDLWVSIVFRPTGDILYSNPMFYAKNLYINGKLLESEIKLTTATKVNRNALLYGFTRVISVTIGKSVTEIEEKAFERCYRLVEVCNNSSIDLTKKNSNETNQYGLTQVKNFYSNSNDNSKVVKQGDFIIYVDDNEELLVSYVGSSKQVIIPNNIRKINDYAFFNCVNITSIVIPNNVVELGKSAFRNCVSLVDVKMSENMANMGVDVFNECSSLVYIKIPKSVTSIGDRVFYGCSSLTSVVIPDSVTNIGSSAFSGCTSLTSIEIPNSVTSIGPDAFYGCTSLTSVVIGDNVTSIGTYAFGYCKSLTSVVIPDSVTNIGSSAFSGCTSLTSVVIGDNVTSIGSFAFCGCSSLTSITFEDTSTWYRTTSSSNWNNKTNGTSTNVTSSSSNATYFKSTYYNYYWYKL